MVGQQIWGKNYKNKDIQSCVLQPQLSSWKQCLSMENKEMKNEE